MICLACIISNLIGSQKACWSPLKHLFRKHNCWSDIIPPATTFKHLIHTSFRSGRHKNHGCFKKITNIPIDIKSCSSQEVCQTFKISLDQMNQILKMCCFVIPNDVSINPQLWKQSNIFVYSIIWVFWQSLRKLKKSLISRDVIRMTLQGALLFLIGVDEINLWHSTFICSQNNHLNFKGFSFP